MIIPTYKNPKFNGNINPRLNSSISPIYNSNINPVFNSNINPTFNSNINPLFNSKINPIFNSEVNPILNSSISPIFNSRINPVFNYGVNPKLNPNFSGFFIFDLNLNPIEFIVLVHKNFIQVFNTELKNVRFGVGHSQKGFVLFGLNNIYAGHLESDSSTGYNEFNHQNQWTSIVK